MYSTSETTTEYELPLLEENPSAERESAVEEAEALCPALAIRVHKK